ncbi:MAG: ABC transporter permease [Myxococcales bacterium]
MDTVLQDVKAALRSLRARPGFSLAAILTLGLAIGANTAIFSVVEAVLLRQLPYRDPDRVFSVWNLRTDGDREPMSIPDFQDLRAAATQLEGMAAVQFVGVNLTGDGDPERIFAAFTTGGWFETLGVRPALGRFFLPAEIDEGAHVALLTDALWRRRFGADPRAVGKQLVVGDDSYEIVGVLPRDFLFTSRVAEVAVPLSLKKDPRASRRANAFLRVVARLRHGATAQAAAAELTSTLHELARRFPVDDARKQAVLLVPAAEELVGQYRSMLLLLLSAVALVLLVGCANLVSLMLAQGAARRREFAIRAALGAVRGRLLQQVIVESLTLAIAGGAIGVGLARVLTGVLIALSPQQIPRIAESGVSVPVLLFALAVSIASGVASGILPALQAGGVSPLEGLGDGRASPGPAAARTRRVLVAAEVALSVVLLTLAGLLARSFARLQGVDPGFDAAHVLTARLSLPPSRYKDAAALARFAFDVRERLAALPGVVASGTVHSLPLGGVLSTVDFWVEGRPPPRREEIPQVRYHMASPGLFRALGIPLLSGRDFDDRDTPGAPPVVIVSKRLADQFFPGQSAVGQRLRIDDGAAEPRLVEIAGVAGDVAQDSLEEPRTFHAYVPLAQITAGAVTYARNVFLVMRTSGDPFAAAPSLLREVRAIDSLLPASSVRSMEQAVATVLAPRRFSLVLVQSFGAAALVLAALGVYALTAFAVTQRKRELGIRLALGAAPAALLRATVFQSLRPALAGLCGGVTVALVAARLASGLLYQISPRDPVALAAAVIALGTAATLAAWMPARRVARIDPVEALRTE